MIIGAINWGLVGLGMFFSGNWNLVYKIFGGAMWLEALIYVLVGLAGLMLCFGCKCKACGSCSCGPEKGGMDERHADHHQDGEGHHNG